MSQFIIRPIGPHDREQWEPLWRAYLAFYETEVPDRVTDTTFGRLCDDKRTQQNALVAEKDGALVGFVHYIFHAHNWRSEDITYLQDLYVCSEQRGTGLGRALIEAVYAEADKNNTPAVYWMTQDFNANARKLYDRIGALTPFIKYTR